MSPAIRDTYLSEIHVPLLFCMKNNFEFTWEMGQPATNRTSVSANINLIGERLSLSCPYRVQCDRGLKLGSH